MEVVRHFLDADAIKSIIPLPDSFRNRRLEVIVMPAEQEKTAKEQMYVEETLRTLAGALPDSGMTLDEYRAERLAKYAAID